MYSSFIITKCAWNSKNGWDKEVLGTLSEVATARDPGQEIGTKKKTTGG